VPRCTDDEASVAAALAPYAWRELTDRMLARMVVGAVDGHSVHRFLATVPGTLVGGTASRDPADADDDRVHALAEALDGRQWRAWSLTRLCADLIGALQSWQAEQDSLDHDLRRLLEGP